MESRYDTPADLVQAAAATPRFLNAFQAAPASISFQGRTYSRSAARSISEKVWYLAACAMISPETVLAIGQTAGEGYGFEDPPKDEVKAAQEAVRAAKKLASTAEAAWKGLSAQHKEAKRQLAEREAEQSNVLGVKDFGDGLLTILSGGINKQGAMVNLSVQVAKLKSQVNDLASQVTTAKAQLDAAKSNVRSAESDLKEAQAAYDAEVRNARAAEERERQAALAEEQRAAAQAAADARALAAANQPTYGGGWPGGSVPDYATEGGEEIFGDETGWYEDSGYLDQEEAADLYGSIEQAEDIEGHSFDGESEYSSPFQFDRYYADCDGCEGGCPGCGEAFGADYGELVTGILAGVLVAAPAVVKQFAPPPQQTGAPGANGQANPKEGLLDTVLKESGLQTKIDAAADRAGANARPDLLVPALIIGGVGLLIALRR